MARGINKVILIGNLGGDPEVRFMPAGGAVANVTIATSETWKDKQSGQAQERTEWHRVVFFNRLAEIVGEYLKKGAKIYIEGSLRTRKWQDKAGQDRYTTEIVASELQMLDGKGSAVQTAMASSSEAAFGDGGFSSSSSSFSSNQSAKTPASPFSGEMGEGSFDDDDIPF